jgi:hypothetical protein
MKTVAMKRVAIIGDDTNYSGSTCRARPLFGQTLKPQSAEIIWIHSRTNA